MTLKEAEKALEIKHNQFVEMIRKGKELGIERRILAKISNIFREEITNIQDNFPGEFPSAW